MAGSASSTTSHFHEDIVLGKAFDRRLMARLLRYSLPYSKRMIQVMLLIILVTGLGLVGPFLVKYAIDHPLNAVLTGQGSTPPGAVRELIWLTGIFLLLSIVLLFLRFLQTYSMAVIGQNVMLDLRSELFDHLQRMPLAFFDANPVGRLVTRITSDVEALNELFASGVVTFFADVLVLLGITTALFWVDPYLALVTLGVLPLLLAVTFIFRTKARRYYREQRGHLAHLNSFTQESIQGMSIIQLFHREKEIQKNYGEINGSYLSAFQKTVLAYSLYFPAVEVISTLALAGIVWQSAVRIQAGALTFGGFYLFWYFLGRFFMPVRDMAERYNVLQSAMASAERIFQVLDTPEGLPSRPGERTPVPGGKVEFKDVCFAYRGEDFVLRDVSFTVNPGEMVALVGATGAGKSTVMHLLGRQYDPQRGTIEVNGVDVVEYDKQHLRRRIGIVLQDVFLFSRSVRENIRLGNEDISDTFIESCARRVNADGFVRALEGGYDHVLTERGGTLSAGEKQLLAFARAIAHEPEILVLDEATANVDTRTEHLIQEALEELFRNRTSIVIAHRLSTVRRADRILVFHKGKIREQGNHAELLKKGGIYSRLHQLQYR